MATTASSVAKESPHRDSYRFRLGALLLVSSTVALAAWASNLATVVRPPSLAELVVWGVLIAIASLIPIEVGSIKLALELPLTLAAAFSLGPAWGALVAWLGCLDVRELRRQMTLVQSAWNRTEVALGVMVAGLAYFALLPDEGVAHWWPLLLAAGVVGVLLDAGVNHVLVVLGLSLRSGRSFAMEWRGLATDTFRAYFTAYLCLGLLSIPIALAWDAVGLAALPVFVAPILLGREAVVMRRSFSEARAESQAADAVLGAATARVADERRDERLVIAGELHDEVLPPLFKVHLMGQVVRNDLDSGRLLDLGEDVPELVSATEHAQGAIRGLIGNLRRSSVGPAGLAAAIAVKARELETAGGATFTLDMDDSGVDPAHELALYQCAREAMSNAAVHARASHVSVTIRSNAEGTRLSVVDDGQGFDPRVVNQDEHFGLQLLAERTKAIGGYSQIDSRLGYGSTVVIVVPRSTD